MAEIAVSDLAPALRKIAVKARQAAEQNESAVVRDLCGQVLSAQPGCLGVRELWFNAELRAGPRPSGVMGRMRGWWANTASKRAAEGNKSDEMVTADGLLADDFSSRIGWEKLIQAAHHSGMIETELLAWRTLAGLYPDDRMIGLGWAQALHHWQRDDAALLVAQKVLERHPTDGQALTLVRQISVAVTMKSGKLKPGGNPTPSDSP